MATLVSFDDVLRAVSVRNVTISCHTFHKIGSIRRKTCNPLSRGLFSRTLLGLGFPFVFAFLPFERHVLAVDLHRIIGLGLSFSVWTWSGVEARQLEKNVYPLRQRIECLLLSVGFLLQFFRMSSSAFLKSTANLTSDSMARPIFKLYLLIFRRQS